MKFILCFLLVTSRSLAQDFVFDKEKGRAVPSYVGQMKLMKGKVFKKTGEAMKDAQLGERFKKDDVIITGEKSYAKVLLVDDTIISIGPQSEVKIDEFDFTDKSDRKFALTLIKGQITGNVKNKAAHPGDIKFRSKYTAMGIRGTYILMNAHAKDSLDIAEYALLSGKAEVTDHKNSPFALKKGDYIVFIRDQEKDMSDLEERNLSKDEFNALSAMKIDEEKEFKPFLPYFDPKGLKESSVLYKYFNLDSTQLKKEETVSNKREEKKPGWEENLKKLNEKLKENQKKR